MVLFVLRMVFFFRMVSGRHFLPLFLSSCAALPPGEIRAPAEHSTEEQPSELPSASMTDFLLANQPTFQEQHRQQWKSAADRGPDAFFENCQIGASKQEKDLHAVVEKGFRQLFDEVLVMLPASDNYGLPHMAPVLCALKPSRFILFHGHGQNTGEEGSSSSSGADHHGAVTSIFQNLPDSGPGPGLIEHYRAVGLLGSTEFINEGDGIMGRVLVSATGSGGPSRGDLRVSGGGEEVGRKPLTKQSSFVEFMDDEQVTTLLQQKVHSPKRTLLIDVGNYRGYRRDAEVAKACGDVGGGPTLTCFAIGHGNDEDPLWSSDKPIPRLWKRLLWPPREFADAIFRVIPPDGRFGPPEIGDHPSGMIPQEVRKAKSKTDF